MNDVASKTPGNTLTSNDFNATQDEVELVCTTTGESLDAADTGGGGDHEMLARSVASYAGGSWAYTDSGTANAHVVTVATSMESPAEYHDNLMVAYIPGNTNTSTTVTVNVAGLGVKALRLIGGGLPPVGSINATKGLVLKYNDSAGYFEAILGASQVGLVQMVSTEDGEVSSAATTGATLISNDDNIPQITEGHEVMTRTITPKNTANNLVIDVVVHISHNQTNAHLVAGLFQDSTSPAIACGYLMEQDSDTPKIITFRHIMAAGTISETTLRVRIGCDVAGTTTFNGVGGSRLYGGVLASSIVVQEIA